MSDTVRFNGNLFRHHSANTKKRTKKSYRLSEKMYVKKIREFFLQCCTRSERRPASGP